MKLKDKIENIFPLTPLQKGLLFHSLYNPESAVYFEQLHCRLEGHVCVNAVNQAWQTLVNRHGILRTAIITKGQAEPVQIVFRDLDFKVAQQDWRGLSAAAQKQRLQTFLEEDCRQGFVINRPPLMRVTLIRLDEESWEMVWSHHHLLLDGWSQTPLMREFFLLHKSIAENVEISLPPVRPFSDLLNWIKQKDRDAEQAFWRNYIGGFASHTPLPMMPNRQPAHTGKSVEIRYSINSKETTLLTQLSRNCNVTLNTIIQGAWAILLNRYSRNQDIVYGITVAGRPPELSGVESMVGPFINTLPLRILVPGSVSLEQWLQDLQQQQVQTRNFEHSSLLDIQRHSDVPLGQPLFESLLAFENFPMDKFLKAEDFGLFISQVSFFEKTHYPLTMVVIPGSEILLKLTYHSDRFQPEGMELLLQHFYQLLLNMVDNPQAPLSNLSLLEYREQGTGYREQEIGNRLQVTGDREQEIGDRLQVTGDREQEIGNRGQVTGYREQEIGNRGQVTEDREQRTGNSQPSTVNHQPSTVNRQLSTINRQPSTINHQPSTNKTTLHQWFADTVGKYGDRTALVYGESSITYNQLESRSNQISHFLKKQGVGPDKKVVICLERSPELILAMLGVVKAGGVYVPVDPAYPRDRIEYTVTDCQAQLILTTTGLSSLLPPSVPTVLMDGEDGFDLEPTTPPMEGNSTPEQGAYVIYTSGSTGKPKGVLVSQHNVTRLFTSTEHWYGFNQDDTWTFFHSFAFDFSVWEIWGALLYGGKLVIVPYGQSRDPRSFLQLVREQKVTVLNQTPSAFTQFLLAEEAALTTEPTSLRYIIFGGEALNLQSLRPWFERHGEERTRLVNMYGITETTVHVTYRPINRADLDNLSGSVIGQPIPDLQIYLLDPHGNQVPTGVIGEIHVGGAGVACGYLNKPEQNQQRFITNPKFKINNELSVSQNPKSKIQNLKLYRTGDLGRFLPNGDLEYLGRIDHQVKIRGFRIEIGEIQVAISQFPGVQENLVIVDDGRDGQQLIAYLVCEPGVQPTIETLRHHLQQHLPDYMVPSQFIFLDKFPLTTNGKIDRKALPTPEITRDNLGVAFVPPENKEEEILAQIWQQVLKVEQVGRFDNYFVLGGDSIRSIRVCSLAEAAGLQVELEEVFAYPVLSELATAVREKQAQAREEAALTAPFSLVAPPDREKLHDWAIDAYPLGQLQAGMLFESDYAQGVTAYNDLFSFRVRMPFDGEIWSQAYAQMLDRHSILRTAFYLGEFSQPLQVIPQNTPAAKIIFSDLTALTPDEQATHLESFHQRERLNRFDWSTAPLMRFYLHQLDQETVQLTFAIHHAILDGWSLSVFIAELSSLYFHLLDGRVPPLPPSPQLQYSRFVALEQAALHSQEQRSFWQTQLAGIPFTKLPRYPGAGKHKTKTAMARVDIALPKPITSGLKNLSNHHGIPLRTVLLAIHMRWLAFCAGEPEVVTGLICNGRPTESDGDRILGLFLNTLPFRLQLDGGSWIDLIRQTFDAEQGLMPNRRFPFAEIQRMHGHQPLYETVFNFVHFHAFQGILQLRDVELIESRSFDETNIPLSVNWSQDVLSENLLFNITYDSNEFDHQQIAAMVDYCTQMCAGVVDNPQGNYATAPMELQDVGVGGKGEAILPVTHAPYLTSAYVHSLFEMQAAQNPDKIAVIYGNQSWTNSQLNQKANQLARFLRSQGVDLDQPVGICLERSFEMVYGILGVLKAGGCYVPIDPHYPRNRIHAMVEDSRTTMVLSDSKLAGSVLADVDTRVIFLDYLEEEIAAQPHDNLEIPIFPDNIAYLIFTSGSTGRAKGIAISHQSLAHHMAWFVDDLRMNGDDVFLQKTPFSFDGSIWEFWAPLMTGAKLVMAKPGGHQDSAYLMQTIQQHRVTILQVVPTLLEILLDEPELLKCSSLRLVLSGGEALKKRVLQQFNQTMGIEIVNIYGPAEATLNASFNPCPGDDITDTVPIGQPLPNTYLYILDSHGQPVPMGTPGELYIAGLQLARGYWHASRLTADRFLPNPFSGVRGDRMYRSGDRVRLLPSGKLEFLGRIDHQIKIRGFRVETGEIISVLESQPGVGRAMVKAFSSPNQPNRLVAYVEMAAPPQHWQETLRFQVRNALPDYMVPSLFVRVDTFELLPNGKINVNALQEPESADIAITTNYVAPRNRVESTLTQIWQDVLKVPHVGIHHDFFELGGDSIVSLQIIAKARAAGIHFSPADIFQHSSIARLAPQIQHQGIPESEKILFTSGEVPLTPIQQWFFQQPLAHPEQSNQAILLDLKADIALGSLQGMLEQITACHEVFRLRFRSLDGWQQYLVEDGQTIGFDTVDLREINDEALEQEISAVGNQSHGQLDLEHGPLARAVYFQTRENTQNKLLLIIHHLIVDGVSWRVLLQDLAMAMQTATDGIGLFSPQAGFAQWAVQLHQHQTSELAGDLEFWQAQQVASPLLPMDLTDNLAGNTEGSTAEIECQFTKEETDSLLYELTRTRQAKIQETLLTVLLQVVTDWIGKSEIAIATESHGRDNRFTNVDILQSVGWFTSLFPLGLHKTSDDLFSNLEGVKAQLRQLPHNGFSYGLLRSQAEFAPTLPQIPQGIVFNYLGQFDENFPTTAPFTPSLLNSGVAQHPQNQRYFQLEVVGLIFNGQLQIKFVYSQALHQESTIRRLANNFSRCLQTLLAESRTREESRTPADFPLASVNPEQLAVVLEGTSDVEDIYPLAPVQEGMVFHANYDSASGAYIQQVTAQITGVLDVVLFRQAWEYTIARHPSLRTSFVIRDLPRPLQRVHHQVNLPFAYHDWSDLNRGEIAEKWQELLATERQQTFSLETPPLMGLTLVRTQPEKWQFIWTHHHLLLDGWSLPLIFIDVINYYQAQHQGREVNWPQPPAYRDFIHWLSNQSTTSAKSFWSSQLQGLQSATSLQLTNPAPEDYQVLQTTLSEEVHSKLMAFAQRNQVTINTLIQGAWSLLLSRYSGDEDIVFGITVSGRPPELANSGEIVGLFINTLPLRVQLNAASTVKSWLQFLRDSTVTINQYSYSRLVDIQGWSDIPRGQPLFESIVVYENYPVEESLRDNSGDLVVHSVESQEKTHYPVTLSALPGEDLLLKLAFAENVGDSAQRQQLLQGLVQILSQFAHGSPEFVGEIGLCSPMEVDKLRQNSLHHNQKYQLPSLSQTTVQEIISHQASLTPDAPAVAWGESCLTYGELERRSNQLAHGLLQRGIKPETLVGVCLERHGGLLVALLGILKAGAAYVPLDPSFPQERLDFMVADSGLGVIVADNITINQFDHISAQTLVMDAAGLMAAAQPATPLPGIVHNQSLAYVIYTSGSTGKPKGVQISHQALVNLLLSFRSYPGLSARDTLVAVTTLSFDISILELFLPLISGAKLVVAGRETVRDGFELKQLLEKSQATIMQATPTTWRLLLTADWRPQGSFRGFCGGEAIPVDLAASLLNLGVELWNVYGPTETTIWSTLRAIKQPEDVLSIGAGIANTSVYILDNAGNLVPPGVIGKVFIAGAGLARGYFGQPQLTSLKFIPHPFGNNPGERLYDTGDLGRLLPNGEIEFLGRGDFQVKIRGFRIELGDIETVLANHPAIAQAVVQTAGETPSDKKLVAYVVIQPNTEKPDLEALRLYILEKLPDYMVPTAWVFLDAMPLTPNNKIDRRALKLPDQMSAATGNYIAPRNVIESALAEIWQELIQVEKAGVQDNFFELGGHSLIAAQIHARMKKIFAIDFSLRELFDFPTIEKTAQMLQERETQPGRTEKICRAFLRMKQMTPEQKAQLLAQKRKIGNG
ncbi:MAG: amino acid adenylation domain-containing protein [Calothrix sp. MO_167.B42]|nr:amino acid adenylation domain-containing protein [Calothrix sp. MO_167.B42]